MRIFARSAILVLGLAILVLAEDAWAQGPSNGAEASYASRSAYARRRAYSFETAARRSTAARGYRPSPYTRGTVGVSSGAAYRDDPLRPFSEEARRRTSAVSSTREIEAPPSPPQVRPQYRHNYYPMMRAGAFPNSNIPRIRSHCIPSRSSVISGRVAGAY